MVGDGSSGQRQQQQQRAPAAAASPAAARGGESPGDKAEPEEDCMGCRLTGLMLGLGGAGYLSSALWVDPPPRGAHRAAILAASAALLALGLGRAAGF